MTLLLNILWFVLGGGFFSWILWLLLGGLLCLTVVGIPFGVAAFRIAGNKKQETGNKKQEGEETALLFLARILFLVSCL